MKNVTESIKNMGYDVKSNLKKSYNEAIQNPDFKNFIDKLKLNEKDIIKNLSELKVCNENYKKCKNCKNIMECSQEIKGYCYLPKIVDGNLFYNYQQCKYKTKIEKQNYYLKNISIFNEPSEIRNASIDKIYKNDKNRYETIEWLYKFIKEYKNDKNQKGLYLYGNFGCGKTYLISSILNELAKDNIKSSIVFWPEFLRDLKASFDTDFKEKYDFIKKTPILLIDDIGAENTTAWGRDEILCPLLQYRMQENLTTFFTSNLDYNDLEQHFAVTKDNVDVIKARRIIERIKQLTNTLEMVSKNLRS